MQPRPPENGQKNFRNRNYLGQLVECPEVITEGKNLDDCRELFQDALQEMIAAYRQQDKEFPLGGGLIEQIPVEI